MEEVEVTDQEKSAWALAHYCDSKVQTPVVTEITLSTIPIWMIYGPLGGI